MGNHKAPKLVKFRLSKPNPDEITKSLLKENPSPFLHEPFKANKAAQDIADKRRQAALDEGRSLSFETVMSHPSKVEFMRQAKARGYKIDFFFVGTDDPLINLDRVRNRVKEGGHDVPPDKTVSRYEKTMKLLSEAVALSDRSMIYDNSLTDNPLRLVSIVQKGKDITYLNDPPYWVRSRLLEFLKSEQLKEESPFKEKAKDFKVLSPKNLLDKYPGDKNILDALAVQNAAHLFADRHLPESTDQKRFLETVKNRVSYNLEHGRPNHSPQVLEQQERVPPEEER